MHEASFAHARDLSCMRKPIPSPLPPLALPVHETKKGRDHCCRAQNDAKKSNKKRSDRSDVDNNSYTSKTTAFFGAEVTRKEERARGPYEDQNKILHSS